MEAARLALFFGTVLCTAMYMEPFTPPNHWQAIRESNPEQVICLQMAIKHDPPALRKLEQLFWDVSDPLSSRYGQFLSRDELTKFLDSDRLEERLKTVETWILDNVRLVGPTRTSANRDYYEFCTKIKEVESLLHTRFHVYGHLDPVEPDLTEVARASKSIWLPDEIYQIIDFIGGANAPIHHSSKTPAYGGAAAVEATPNATPDEPAKGSPKLLYVTPGDTEIAAGWQAFCKDGTPNKDVYDANQHFYSLCASNPPAITSFQFVMTDKDDDSKVLPVLPKACQLGKGATVNKTFPFFHTTEDPSYCSAVAGSVRMYNGLRIHIRTLFEDGTVAESQVSMQQFATDFATPSLMRQLYEIPEGLRAVHPDNSQSVAEFLEQYYNPKDLDIYLDMMGLRRQKVDITIGPNNATEGSISGGEAQLDIQVIMGLAPGAKTTFWSVAGRDSIQEEPFIKWLMDLADMEHPPLVHSISYSDAEGSMPVSYTDRLNVEFQKLGVRGLTLLFASGDDGASGATDCSSSEPDFPSSSPYVVSVGATQLTDKGLPVCLGKWRGVDIATTKKERACSSDVGGVITSGGGYSDRYPMPDYQKKHVEFYQRDSGVEHPSLSNYYTPTGRGYPDISAYGNNFVVIMGGQIVRMSGTSASTPVVAAMITLWNDIRLAAGQPPLGFINPLLYHLADQHPESFNDVVIGDNRCPAYNHGKCCEVGFNAGPGWDAVTGLGTPNFRIIASYLAGHTVAPYSTSLMKDGDAPPTPTSKPSKPFVPASKMNTAALPKKLETIEDDSWGLGAVIFLVFFISIIILLVLTNSNKFTPKREKFALADSNYGAFYDED